MTDTSATTKAPPDIRDEELRSCILDWAAEWRGHRRSTAPADRATAEAAFTAMFEAAGRPRPRVDWSPSPGAAARRYYWHLEPVQSRWGGRHEIADEWVTSRRPSALAGPGEVPAAWLRAAIHRTVAALPLELPPSRWRRTPMELLEAVADVVGLRDSLGAAIDRQVDQGLASERRGPRTRATARSIRDGQFDAIAPALALGPDVLGLTLRRDRDDAARFRAFLDARLAIVRSAGPWWVAGDEVIVAERPLGLGVDAQGRLHAADGPALAYGDGSVTFAWHGVRVPSSVIDDPASITVEAIDAELNSEVRAVMLERFGVERFVREGGARLVHEDETGRLWAREMPPNQWGRRDDPIVMVEVENATPEPDGSRTRYLLRVPPAMRTAREAVAWTFSLGAVEYRPERES